MQSLNLLPPKQKHELIALAHYRQWQRLLTVLLVFGLVSTGIFVAAWRVLVTRDAKSTADLTALQALQAQNAGTDITTTTNALNTTIKSLSTTLGPTQAWDVMTSAVLSAIPKGAAVSQLTILPNAKFHLIGVADTRQTFLQLDAALKDPSKFNHIVTSSTASKRQAVPFDYTGAIGGAS